MCAKSAAVGVGLSVVMILGGAGPTFGQQLQLDGLTRLAAQAAGVVDVTVDPATLEQLVKAFAGQESDPKLKEIISGLKGVYVKSFEFKDEGAYTEADVEAIRSQLKAPWSRIVSVREQQESVDVYLWMQGKDPEGLAVLAAEPKELTVVNIVGRIDLAALAALKGLGLPAHPQNLVQKAK
jgi:hypothetical protein